MYDLDHLNPQQRVAVESKDNQILILAGPGTGKTHVLAHRLAYLLHERKVNPKNILAITFTTKAAIELKAQLESMLSIPIGQSKPYSRLYFGTFRSVCISILRKQIERLGYNTTFSICDEVTRLARIEDCLSDLHVDPVRFKPRAVSAKIRALKNRPALFKKPSWFGPNTVWEKVVAHVYTHYESMLYESHELDSDDIFLLTLRLFRQNLVVLVHYQNLFRHILIDEYQELTPVQHQLARMLSTQTNSLFAAGDDDQSIFNTCGADVSKIINFDKYHPKGTVLTLAQNYRSTGNILDAANAVISCNRMRKIKALWTKNGAGNSVLCYEAHDENDEANFICRSIIQEMKSVRTPWDIAILYRTSAQSAALEDALGSHRIPYQVFDDSAFNGQREIVGIPTCTPMVTLMTLHNAKGLEFPIVFIAGVAEGLLPHSRSEESEEDLEEERRLFYVGITRAIKRLIITYAKERNLYGYRQECIASRFINEFQSAITGQKVG